MSWAPLVAATGAMAAIAFLVMRLGSLSGEPIDPVIAAEQLAVSDVLNGARMVEEGPDVIGVVPDGSALERLTPERICMDMLFTGFTMTAIETESGRQLAVCNHRTAVPGR